MTNANGKMADAGFLAPHFDRLNYFYGQMLSVNDFCAEQNFFRDKMKLHNRCLHGYGTVCGLRVVPVIPPADCADKSGHPSIVIEPGLALDAEGNELIIRADHPPYAVDLWKSLSASDQQTVLKKIGTDPEAWYCEPLYVSLRYQECGHGPSRPVVVDSCGKKSPNTFGMLRDSVCVTVSLTPPPEDKRCDTCCCTGPCGCDALLLARIDRFHPTKPIKSEDIHNDVRRRIGIYTYTTITGVNWRHGHDYHQDKVRHLLKEGLVIHFSRPVFIDPHQHRGVIDVYHIESRSTRHPNIIELRGEIVVPCSPTKEVRYRIVNLEECPESCDRLLIVVRCGFILDECCRPVDGLHVGGKVPYVGGDHDHDAREHVDGHCVHPSWGYGPWTSGNGTGGGTFESWLYVEAKKGAHHER